LKVNWHVAMRPGKCKALDLSSELARDIDRVEQIKASIRAKVEHRFRAIKQQFGHARVRQRGLTQNTARLTKAVRAEQPADGAPATVGTAGVAVTPIQRCGAACRPSSGEST
jgi:IS5 family transposase